MVIGPLVISLPRLFLLLGIVAAMFSAYVIRRRTGYSVEKPLWLSLAVGLLAARAGFVLLHLDVFAARPWHALYLWQGGFRPMLGVFAAAIVMLLACVPPKGHARRQIIIPFVTALAVWGGLNWVHDALEQATTRYLPTLTLQQIDGASVALNDFRGQPVVLNLWATWCPPCRREMPMLDAAQESRAGVHFLFVNQGEGRNRIREYLASEDLQLRNVLLDTGRGVTRSFNVRGLPTTLFFNAGGRLVNSHIGMLTQAILADYLDRL